MASRTGCVMRSLMYDHILARRSIRRYTGQAVDDSLLQKLVDAGFQAPTARNLQPWHFVVVIDRSVIDALQKEHSAMSMASEASALIVVCADAEISSDFWRDDAAAATMNILHAAHALGLGTCWCAVTPHPNRMDAFRSILGIPPHVMPYAAVAVGYPGEQKGRPDRTNAARIHRNRW